MRLKPKNWDSFQHYKDRCPPWVKLHKSILDDRAFMSLPLASKALAPLMWLLASESKDGTFDGSVEELAFRLRITEKEIAEGIKPLIDKGFFLDASTMLAPASDLHTFAVPETETETETETEQKKKSARGTRLPADWQLTDELKAIAKQIRPEWPDNHVQRIADGFKDYWLAKSGKDATKADWVATWRNWCRNDKSAVWPSPQGSVPSAQTRASHKPMPTMPPRKPRPEGLDLG